MLGLVLKDSCTKIPHSHLNTVLTLHHTHQPHKLSFLLCFCCCNITMPYKTRSCCYSPLSIHTAVKALILMYHIFHFPIMPVLYFLKAEQIFCYQTKQFD